MQMRMRMVIVWAAIAFIGLGGLLLFAGFRDPFSWGRVLTGAILIAIGGPAFIAIAKSIAKR